MLIDTHCHIHGTEYPLEIDGVIERANQAGVTRMITVGTNIDDSKKALDFAVQHDGVFASVGVHPHYSVNDFSELEKLVVVGGSKLVAIGEIGLDYYKNSVPPVDQIKMLQIQIKIAIKYDLPIIFHVRDAFDDFWPVFDSFIVAGQSIRGVLHCFTDTAENAQKGIERGLYISINGIATFAKDESQLKMYAGLPLDKIVFETDAPYLTPVPFRGTVNEPAFVKNIAEHYGGIRQVSVDYIARFTTANALTLFNLLG